MPHPCKPDLDRTDLTAAFPEDIAEALFYALCHDERGKPRRSSGEVSAGIAAERLAGHLRRAGTIVMKARGARPHSTG